MAVDSKTTLRKVNAFQGASEDESTEREHYDSDEVTIFYFCLTRRALSSIREKPYEIIYWNSFKLGGLNSD